MSFGIRRPLHPETHNGRFNFSECLELRQDQFSKCSSTDTDARNPGVMTASGQ
jgi:hypothetical protein